MFRSVGGAPEGVQVFAGSLDLDDERLERLAGWLSDAETARARRFRFPRDRRRYVARRALLRCLLGEKVRAAPGALVFGWGPRGKPYLVEPHRARRLGFNDSHSSGLALFALAWDRVLGVDIERLRPVPEADDIVRRTFAPEEAAEYEMLPLSERLLGFFNAWTRKEAVLKATGEGFSREPAEVCVTLVPGVPARLRYVAGDPEAAKHWALHTLELPEGTVGALCVERRAE